MGKDYRRKSLQASEIDVVKRDYKLKKKRLLEEDADEEWFDDDDEFEQYAFGDD